MKPLMLVFLLFSFSSASNNHYASNFKVHKFVGKPLVKGKQANIDQLFNHSTEVVFSNVEAPGKKADYLFALHIKTDQLYLFKGQIKNNKIVTVFFKQPGGSQIDKNNRFLSMTVDQLLALKWTEVPATGLGGGLKKQVPAKD